ncbi:MAG: YceI family protein [Nitrospinota bacterium]|nr:YceI family protein [Nitrospinota bacterium]
MFFWNKIGFLVFFASVFFANIALAASWKIDPSHTSVSFKIRHLGVSWVRGEFRSFEGRIEYDPQDISKTKVSVTIDTISIDTRNERRDAHLRSPDFFDVDTHPEIKFSSTKILNIQQDGFDVLGNLKIRGITKKIKIKVSDISAVLKRRGRPSKMGASGKTKFNRKDFNVSWNRFLDNGGLVLSETVFVNLEVELNKMD